MDEFKTKPQIHDLTNQPSTRFLLIGVKYTKLSFSTKLHDKNDVKKSLEEAEKEIRTLSSSDDKSIWLSDTTVIPHSSLKTKYSYDISTENISAEKSAKVVIIVSDDEQITEKNSVFYIKKSEILKDENRLGKLNTDVIMTNTDVKLGMSTADSCVINLSGLDKSKKIFRCEVNLGHSNCDISDIVLNLIENEYECKAEGIRVSVAHYAKSRYYVGLEIYEKYSMEYPNAFNEVSNLNLLNTRDRLSYLREKNSTKFYIFDWPKIFLIQLESRGVLRENIKNNSLDTFDYIGFSSYRSNLYEIIDEVQKIKTLFRESKSIENLIELSNAVEKILFFYKENSHLADSLEEKYRR